MTTRTLCLLALGALALSACSINVDGDTHGPGYNLPRTATDLCRREVDRTYDSRYRIAYELPELSTDGPTQTVRQAFTLALRKENFEAPERRALRCVVRGGELVSVSEVR